MAGRQAVDFDVERAAVCLAGQPEVVLAYLFGSVARGEADRLSDVDVAVLLDESLGPEERVDRQLRLMAALSDFSARETQVMLLNDAPHCWPIESSRRASCFTSGAGQNALPLK